MKQKLMIAGAVLLALVGGVLVGRFTGPAKVEYKEKVVEIQVESTQAKERIAQLLAEVERYKKDLHEEETEVIMPDKTIVRWKLRKEIVEKEKKVEVVKYVDREVKIDVIKYVDREVTKTVTNHANWLVGLQAGVQVDSLLRGGISNPLPQSLLGDPWLLQLRVEHRIVGGLYFGGFVTSGKAVGLSATLML